MATCHNWRLVLFSYSHFESVRYHSIAELEKDMLQLRNNLKEVEREIEFHRVQPLIHGDRFLPVMKEFLTTATCRFSELEDLFQDMKTRVRIFLVGFFQALVIENKGYLELFASSLTELCVCLERITRRYNRTISSEYLTRS